MCQAVTARDHLPPSVIFDARNWRYNRDYVATVVALEQRITNLGF
jgi:hypothetical protein